jgi:hypothetical protein
MPGTTTELVFHDLKFEPRSKETPVKPLYTNARFLKIKIKSLAAEARIIKAEERKVKAAPFKYGGGGGGTAYRELRNHRILVVREECRLTQIAYGFIRGRTYSQIERPAKPLDYMQWGKIEKMVLKYAFANSMVNVGLGRCNTVQYDAAVKQLPGRFAVWKEAACAKPAAV